MAPMRNNYMFKGHKTLLGQKFVTYGEVELPSRYDLYPVSKNGFDWGYLGSPSKQLAFAMLYQVTKDEEIAREGALNFATEVIRGLNLKDWSMSAYEVMQWVEKNTNISKKNQDELKATNNIQAIQPKKIKKTKKAKKAKSNVVKEICQELQITQKNLAEILEVPEGTISSWAVKNEIPRLGKKAIEFYIQSQKNQQIVDSYKSFLNLMKEAS